MGADTEQVISSVCVLRSHLRALQEPFRELHHQVTYIEQEYSLGMSLLRWRNCEAFNTPANLPRPTSTHHPTPNPTPRKSPHNCPLVSHTPSWKTVLSFRLTVEKAGTMPSNWVSPLSISICIFCRVHACVSTQESSGLLLFAHSLSTRFTD